MRDGTGINDSNAPSADGKARARWLGVLAKAEPNELLNRWQALADKPVYRLLRAPETGLVLVRGRIGGIGERFNIGETSVSRCSVAVDDGRGGEVAGHGYASGCDLGHALHAALFDALMQMPSRRAQLENDLIAPLEREQSAESRKQVETAQASRVEFFTMVRGD